MPFDSLDEPGWEPLLRAAWEAREHAHAPYSGFRVGAALKRRGGGIIPGCNVENASYPISLCAERTALCAAVTEGLRPGALEALVVVSEAETPTPPCGACRQALAEFGEALPVLLANRKERVLLDLRELLPRAFTGRDFGAPGVAELAKAGLESGLQPEEPDGH